MTEFDERGDGAEVAKTEVEALREEVALLKSALGEHDEEIEVLKREAFTFATPLAELHKKILGEHGHHETASEHHRDLHVSVPVSHLQAAHAFHERWHKSS
jgi:hypothetical protein